MTTACAFCYSKEKFLSPYVFLHTYLWMRRLRRKQRKNWRDSFFSFITWIFHLVQFFMPSVRTKLNRLFLFAFLALKKMTKKDAESKKGKKRKYHRRHCLFAPPLVMRMPSLPYFPRLWWSHPVRTLLQKRHWTHFWYDERAGTGHYKSCYLWAVNPVKDAQS